MNFLYRWWRWLGHADIRLTGFAGKYRNEDTDSKRTSDKREYIVAQFSQKLGKSNQKSEESLMMDVTTIDDDD